MYDYKGLLMTTKQDTNGNRFGREVLEALVRDQPEVPVRINFVGDPIGSTEKFEITDSDELFCIAKVNIKNMDQLNLFFVPGFIVELRDLQKTDKGNVISKGRLIEVSISSIPADLSLTKIERDE